MAYDQALAARVRDVLVSRAEHSEKHMFGGICFMVAGHMCCGVVKNDLMLRVGTGRFQELLARPHARPMDFTGRPSSGMLYVDPEGVANKRDLQRWLGLALDFVQTLPPRVAVPKAASAGRMPKRPAKKTAPKDDKRSSRSDEHVGFSGFGKPTLTFLRGLSRNNNKTWFTAHRKEYEAHYVDAGAAFVGALGPELRKISRTINYEPRVSGSLFRINRDIRFSKDKTPYKPHLDIWCWEGDNRGWDTPGFFLRLDPQKLTLGVGIHHFDKPKLAAFRQAVIDPRKGKALATVLQEIEKQDIYEIGGRSRKQVPRGFDPDHPRADLLLHDGLTAILRTKHPAELGSTQFVPWCAGHYRDMAPLHRWLLRQL